MSNFTIEQFARLLDGREYGEEITEEEDEIAAMSRLFVFFGYSDDNLAMRGVFNDELTAYDGTEFIIAQTLNPPYWSVVSDEMKVTLGAFIPFKAFNVKASWNPDDLGISWLITTDVPHATFDIFEDGDLFCRGIVVAESDVLEHLNSKGSAQ
jgi:hypothetical protein